ncbi:MAG: hypothetical protein PHT58_03760 [Eubacteriales bacterium]|nr:hypothetical protein [Eubacteriales bacterium]
MVTIKVGKPNKEPRIRMSGTTSACLKELTAVAQKMQDIAAQMTGLADKILHGKR